MELQFLGATRQVTGSQYLLQTADARVLVDCGMFQEHQFLGRNWDDALLQPRKISAVLLSHAHLDHCGLLPRLVMRGFRGPIFATAATADLAEIVLRDSAQIQEEDARFKQKRHRREGRVPKYPPQPLYTLRDVERTVSHFRHVEYHRPFEAAAGLTGTFRDAGHILGSATVEVAAAGDGSPLRTLFSGDLGREDRPLLRDPAVRPPSEYLVLESTYGDRVHREDDVQTQLAEIIARTVARGGNVIVPVFALERSQEMLFHLGRLARAGRLPDVDVYLDSPMAADATAVFARHRAFFDDEATQMFANGESPLKFRQLKIIRTSDESRALNELRVPAVILSTSGMCTAGRIKHHLRHNLPRKESTVLFVGYQARGTLGRQILDRNPEVRIHGLMWPVRAEVAQIKGFSSHADREELFAWLDSEPSSPRQVFLTHGEEEVALALAEEIRKRKGWNVVVPQYGETVPLR